jgi:hypothetical protein
MVVIVVMIAVMIVTVMHVASADPAATAEPSEGCEHGREPDDSEEFGSHGPYP